MSYPIDWKPTPTPRTRLSTEQLEKISNAIAERKRLRIQLSKLTNDSLADDFGVDVRTIEKAIKNCALGNK